MVVDNVDKKMKELQKVLVRGQELEKLRHTFQEAIYCFKAMQYEEAKMLFT